MESEIHYLELPNPLGLFFEGLNFQVICYISALETFLCHPALEKCCWLWMAFLLCFFFFSKSAIDWRLINGDLSVACNL